MPDPARTVLLIDDDDELRSVLGRVLIRAGFNVLTADDGRSGLKLLAKSPVDLLVTDIIMPDVEGIELILKVKKEHPKLPIIAMSAGGRLKAEGYLKMAQSCGANHVLEKPFGIEVLVREVRRLLPSPPAPAA